MIDFRLIVSSTRQHTEPPTLLEWLITLTMLLVCAVVVLFSLP